MYVLLLAIPEHREVYVKRPSVGAFVPFRKFPRSPKQAVNVGWIVMPNGCHIWQGTRDPKGYGRVWFDGRTRPVHRVRYEREIGPIPDGMHMDHFFCDNGPGGCCNPAHVRPVTPRENTLRGDTIQSANAAKTHCKRGHPLSGDNVRVARQGLGQRVCRACCRYFQRCHRAKKRLALARGAT